MQNSLIKIRFWGENHDGLLLKPRNSPEPLPWEADYAIKVGILNFLKYLEDMGKIKLLIIDKKTGNQIGHVIVNLLLYLKRKLNFISFFNGFYDFMIKAYKKTKFRLCKI